MKKLLLFSLFTLLFIITGCSENNQHTHVECKVCGKCILENCTSAEERCQGCEDNEYHEICDICNKCYIPDCSWIEKYKGCSGHIKVVKNHFITFDENIMDSYEKHLYYEIKTYEEFLEFITTYNLNELIVTMDDNIIDKIVSAEYSKEYFKNYDEQYFKTKSLIIFLFKGIYDFREIHYVGKCYYFKGILNVYYVGGMSQFQPEYKCSICSFVEIEKVVFPYIKEMKYHMVTK